MAVEAGPVGEQQPTPDFLIEGTLAARELQDRLVDLSWSSRTLFVFS